MAKKKSNLRNLLKQKRAYLIFKRAGEILFSSFAILLVFPWLLPCIALLIKLDSKGPVFFKQKRVGFLGKKFHCYKFRTMQVNSRSDVQQASEDDPRITGIGGFLRKSGLDELPQFINVFLGDMSIVGPRPHMLKDIQDFSGKIINYQFRHLVRPGITGLSQIKGCRGEVTDDQSMLRRYRWDVYYVRHAGFALDMRIIFETINVMLKYMLSRKKAKRKSVTENLYDQSPAVSVKKIA